jgi:hypothetical protein
MVIEVKKFEAPEMIFIICPVKPVGYIEYLLVEKINAVDERYIGIDKRLIGDESFFIEPFERKNKFWKQ